MEIMNIIDLMKAVTTVQPLINVFQAILSLVTTLAAVTSIIASVLIQKSTLSETILIERKNRTSANKIASGVRVLNALRDVIYVSEIEHYQNIITPLQNNAEIIADSEYTLIFNNDINASIIDCYKARHLVLEELNNIASRSYKSAVLPDLELKSYRLTSEYQQKLQQGMSDQDIQISLLHERARSNFRNLIQEDKYKNVIGSYTLSYSKVVQQLKLDIDT